MTVDIVIVTYESAGELSACLAALSDPAHVTVVDNASTDRSAEIAEAFGATVIRNDTNVGFGAGANLGAQQGRGEYLLFLNPDAELRRGDLDRLVVELDANPGLAVVGPRLALPDGGWQKPWWPFPSARRSVTEAFGLHRLRPEPSPDDHSGFAVGACLVIRRTVFEMLGGFDRRFWLYGEEADLCKRAVDAGWGVRLVEDAIATHIGGASGNSAPGRTLEHFHRGTEHFIAKHEGEWPLLVHRAANVVGQAWRLPLLAVRRSPSWRQRARQIRRFGGVLRRHPVTVVPRSELAAVGERDIVVFSLENWDEIWRRNQFFARQLLDSQPELRVLFVEPPIDMAHRLRTRASLKDRPGLRQVSDDARLWALRPVKWLPRLMGPWADRSLQRQVQRTMSRLGISFPTFWVNDTCYARLVGSTRSPVLYDVTDDWLLADTSGRERQRRAARELITMRRADVVTVCSAALALDRGRHRQVHLIPNGVDVDHMRTPQPRPGDLPDGPTVMYVGTLHEDRLDVDLVTGIAARRPDMQLVFVGPNALSPASKAALARHGNVHLLGGRPYAQVPAYLQHADVLMVPHVLSPFTESLDPIKAYEYAAVGRPVVATPVPGFRGAPWTRSATTVDEFVARIDEALTAPLTFDAGELASWATRAADFAQALDDAGERRRRKPLKVAYLDHCAQLSGGELALSRLLSALDRVEPYVILAEDGPLVGRLERAGAEVEILPMDPNARSLNRSRVTPSGIPVKALVNSARYVLRTARRLREIQPDIVHTNSLKAALYGGIAGRLAGVPVVWHVRDRIAADYLPRPAVKLVQAMARVVPNAVVTNSNATLETLHLVRGVHSVVASPVVYDTVDASHASTPLRPGSGGDLVFALVGRIAPWKGQDVFLKAFAKAFPQSGAHALLIGSAMFGETDFEAELHALVEELSIGDRVVFTGFQDDVASWLASCDVLVHASVIPEPFGQVVVEGMASGVAVIATNAGGPAEVITHDVNGLLVEPGDVDALAAALLRMTDAALRQRLAREARHRASDFAPDQVGRQIMDVYDQVLSK